MSDGDNFMERGGALVELPPFVWRVMGSTHALAACRDLGQVLRRFDVKFWHSISVLCRDRLWVVEDLKRRYKNSLNEWTYIWNVHKSLLPIDVKLRSTGSSNLAPSVLNATECFPEITVLPLHKYLCISTPASIGSISVHDCRLKKPNRANAVYNF